MTTTKKVDWEIDVEEKDCPQKLPEVVPTEKPIEVPAELPVSATKIASGKKRVSF